MFKRGDQILYVPTHAGGNKSHMDVEHGFVTSGPAEDGSYFCRYWSKFDPFQLRTKANSELTPGHLLVGYESHPPEDVEEMLEKYC
jgi:hypothetical protein